MTQGVWRAAAWQQRGGPQEVLPVVPRLDVAALGSTAYRAAARVVRAVTASGRAHRRWLVAAALLLLALLLFLSARDVIHEVRYADIVEAIKGTPAASLALASLATLLSYVALTGYDHSALEYAGARLAYRMVAPTAFAAYALSNTMGLGVLTGGAVRMRLYGAAGVDPGAISRAIAFGAMSFGIGTASVAATALLWDAGLVAPILHLPSWLLRGAAVAWLIALALLLLVCAARSRVPFGARAAALPSLRVATWQLLVSVADIAFAAAALWVLIPHGGVSIVGFVGIFAIATMAGVISHVPGGLGVFEALMLVAMARTAPPEQVAGALVLYRAIYFLGPLAAALVMLSAYELRSAALSPIGRAARGVAPLLLAAFTFVVGVMLMVSGVTPASPEATAFLAEHVPLPLIEASHFLGSVAGVGLVFIARGMLLRLDVAWWAGVVLAGLAFIAALPKGVAVSEAAVLAVLLVALALSRGQFVRKANLLAGAFSARWSLAIGVAFAVIVGLLFFVYRDVDYAHDLWWQFEFDAHAPRSLRAVIGISILLLVLALRVLLRSAPRKVALPRETEIARAQEIVRAQDRAVAGLALAGDKHLLFSDSGRSFVMFGVRGRSWVGLFDPVGPEHEQPELVWRFLELAHESGGRPAFYQVGPRTLPMYLDAGMKLLKVGEEAFVSLPEFSLKGSHRAGLRHAVNRAERDGLSFAVIDAADVPRALPELTRISNAWLGGQHTAEKGFSLGAFKDDYVSRQGVAAVFKDSTMIAFATLMTTDTKGDASVDLMRYVPSAPPGTMDVLFVNLIQHLKNEGHGRFDLGMAPMSGMQEHPLAPSWHRVARLLFEHGESFYNFRGLRSFKAKFDPVWEPRYLAATGGVASLLTLTDVAAMIGGGVRGVFAK